jgi:hypothetical protein
VTSSPSFQNRVGSEDEWFLSAHMNLACGALVLDELFTGVVRNSANVSKSHLRKSHKVKEIVSM